MDARFGDHDAAIGERHAGYLTRRLSAADGRAWHLSSGGAGSREGVPRHDLRDGPAAAIRFGPKGPGGHAGSFDLPATLKLKAWLVLLGLPRGRLLVARSGAHPFLDSTKC